MIRIVLVDDHPIVREGFKRLVEREPDLSIVGEAASRLDALALLAAEQPDLLVTDLSLTDGNAMALIRDVRDHHPGLRCIVVSAHDNPAFVAEALASGADGYVTKDVASDQLVAAVRTVIRGERYLSDDLRASRRTAPSPLDALTPREAQALRLLARGLVPKAAAAELGISEKTFYAHRASLFEKLGARNDRDILRIAIDRGLI